MAYYIVNPISNTVWNRNMQRFESVSSLTYTLTRYTYQTHFKAQHRALKIMADLDLSKIAVYSDDTLEKKLNLT